MTLQFYIEYSLPTLIHLVFRTYVEGNVTATGVRVKARFICMKKQEATITDISPCLAAGALLPESLLLYREPNTHLYSTHLYYTHLYSTHLYYTPVLYTPELYTPVLHTCTLHTCTTQLYYTHLYSTHLYSTHLYSTHLYYTPVLYTPVLHTCTLHTCTLHTCTLHTCTLHTCTLHTCTLHTCTLQELCYPLNHLDANQILVTIMCTYTHNKYMSLLCVHTLITNWKWA